jgi:hypothetical protein
VFETDGEQQMTNALELRVDSNIDLQALHDRLRNDESLKSERTHLALERAERKPGEMGAAWEAISVFLGPDATGVALAAALVAWLRSRHRRTKITVTRESAHVELDGSQSTEDVIRLIQSLNKELPDASTK